MNNGIVTQKDYLEIPIYNSLPLYGIGNRSNIPGINNSEFSLYNPDNFVLVFDTSKEPTNLQISVPLGGIVNCTIFWGDGTNDKYTTTGFKTHIYEKPGVYIVQISGRLTFLGDASFTASNTNNKSKLVGCLSFGNIGITTVIFSNHINLVTCPNTIPNNSIYIMFAGCTLMNNSNVINWRSPNLNSLRSTFQGTRFNQRIDHWDTSNVTDMFATFFNNSTFNQNISSFNTSQVTGMHYAFSNAVSFDQAIGVWDTSNVTNMDNMFAGAGRFNQDLSNWNVRKVTNFTSMFNAAVNFNSSLSGWALGADTAGTSCLSMFQSATSFNQDISNWDTSKVTNMGNMFANQSTGSGFNQNIGSWNTSSVTNMSLMFYANYFFNNNNNNSINSWNTANVTDMNLMFFSAISFNQPIGNWNVSKVTNMTSMFTSAFAFNQDISNWNLAGLNASARLDNFMNGKTGANSYSTANYDALLIGWNNNKLVGANGIANWRTDLKPNFGGAKYTAGGAAATARAALVSYGWTITDGGTA